MSRQGITRLGLSGFQVFSEYVSIPLSRITLLFGPNSAGKSAIEDAIRLAASLWREDFPSWREGVRAHWRRNSKKEDDYADAMRIDITCATDLDLEESFAMESNRFAQGGNEAYFASEIEITTIVRNVPTTRIDLIGGRMAEALGGDGAAVAEHQELGAPKKGFNPHVAEWSARVDGIPLFARRPHGESFINLAHPWLSNIKPLVDFARAAEICPAVFSIDDSHVRMASLEHMSGLYPEYSLLRHPETLQAERLSVEEEDVPEGFASVIPAVREFTLFMNILSGLVSLDVFSNYPVDVVSASRRLPTKEELTLSLNISSFLSVPFEVTQAHVALLPKTGDPRYLPLAKSFIDREIASPSEPAAGTPRASLDSHEKVNHYLSDYLFKDRGFQLTYQHLILFSADRVSAMIENVGEGNEVAIRQYASAAIVQIGLNDLEGRSYTFEQVGSGLGYVLPVLAAIADTSFNVVILQQPELHLHPALQATIGDAFLEASGERKGNLVIETHSEHLLLRILKRVRQTMRGTAVATELRITPTDVSVLYFDPSLDGTTEVKHLRISDDGDFMDRWPRGFFDERDRELFDE